MIRRYTAMAGVAALLGLLCAAPAPAAGGGAGGDHLDSSFGIFGACATEYGWFQQQMGFDDGAYWDWVDAHFVKLGAHWTRSNLQLVWDIVEPDIGGGYRWDNAMKSDAVVARVYASPAKVHWLGVFHEGIGRGDLRDPLQSPEAYAAFVKAAVERYDGDGVDDAPGGGAVRYWQAGNEVGGWTHTGRTAEQYAAYVRLIRGAARLADPGAKIVLIAQTQGFTLEPFTDEVIAQLAPGREFDVVDVHHWGTARDWKMTLLPSLRARLDALGLAHVEIWSCEHGTWAGNPWRQPVQSEQEQARSLVKRFIWNRAHGLDKLFWNNLMEWNNFGGDPGTVYNSMGLVSDGQCSGDPPERLNTERVAYWSYRTLAEKTDTGRAHLVGTVEGAHDEDSVYAYEYERDSDRALFFVLWRESGGGAVRLPVTRERYTVTNLICDRFGNVLQQYVAAAEDGALEIEAGQDPLLVEPESDALAADFTFEPASPTDAAPVTFTALASGGAPPVTFAWDLCGTSGAGESVTRTLAPGACIVTLVATDSAGLKATVSKTVDVARSVTVSGISWFSDPPRLRVSGSGFAEGCKVLIDGTAAPSTRFKSATLAVARGNGLKAQVPRGVQVLISVVNPSGAESAPFPYTR